MRRPRSARWSGCAASLRQWPLLAVATAGSRGRMGKAGSRVATDSKAATISAGRMAINKRKLEATDSSLATVASKVLGGSNLARVEGAGHRPAAASDSRQEIAQAS